MNHSTYNNWVKIKSTMEAQNMTETKFYNRACTCVQTKVDPIVPGGDEYYEHFLKLLDIA